MQPLVKDLLLYVIALVVTIAVAIGIFFWWLSFAPATSALPPLSPGEKALYTYELQETSSGDCRPRWDGCAIVILRNDQPMWTLKGNDIPQHLGGVPVEWLEDGTLITRSRTMSGSNITSEIFYRYFPETNTKDFYYRLTAVAETGPTIIGSWYLYNFGEDEYDYAIWLYKSDTGNVVAHISARPHIDEAWCPGLIRTLNEERERCLLTKAPSWGSGIGPAEGVFSAEGYDVSFEREGTIVTVSIADASGVLFTKQLDVTQAQVTTPEL